MTKKPLLYFYDEVPFEPYRKAFETLAPDTEVRNYPGWGDGSEPAYALVWNAPAGLLKNYPKIEVIFSLGAGVDHLLSDPGMPTDTPIVRMADTGLKEGMAEYVMLHVLMHQRNMTDILSNQSIGKWDRLYPKLAADVTVGIMGYGVLGQNSAQHLKAFGFPINTWSSSPKAAEDGVTHYTGRDQLKAFLGDCDITVMILPATDDTYHLMNSETLSYCKEGAAIINAGRGATLDIEALIEVVNTGHIKSASLDVFETEPLPADHPVWHTKNIIVTPHVAAVTQVKPAVQYILDMIDKYEAGEPLKNMMNHTKGY